MTIKLHHRQAPTGPTATEFAEAVRGMLNSFDSIGVLDPAIVLRYFMSDIERMRDCLERHDRAVARCVARKLEREDSKSL